MFPRVLSCIISANDSEIKLRKCLFDTLITIFYLSKFLQYVAMLIYLRRNINDVFRENAHQILHKSNNIARQNFKF